LKGFGIEEMPQGIIAAGAALHYLQQMQQGDLKHISKVSRIEEERYVLLDKFTIRNLELISSPHDKAKTLIEVLDRTISPMGSRMLRRWLLLPLKEIAFVEERLDIVNHFVHHSDFSDKIRLYIK